MLCQTTSALRMRSRASVLRSCAWTPSHRSPAMRPMSCIIPATPPRDAPLCGCRSSSDKRPTRRARRSHKVTGSWQRSRNTCRPNETTRSLAIMTAYALVQGVLAARRDLRLKHELAVLDVSDAMTILVASPPHPERRTDGPWLGPDDNYADDNYADDIYPDDIYPGALSPITTRLPPRPRQPRPPNPGAAPTAPGPTTQQRLTTHQGGSNDETQGRPRTIFNEPRSMGRCRCR